MHFNFAPCKKKPLEHRSCFSDNRISAYGNLVRSECAKQLHKNHSRERTGYFESVILIFFAKFSQEKMPEKSTSAYI